MFLGIAFLVASTLVTFFFFNENLKNTTLEENHVSVLKQQITDSFIELRKQPRQGVIASLFYFHLCFYVIEFILNYYFNKMVSIDNISSLVSFKSTISRLGSICLLCLLSLMVKVFAFEQVMAVNFMASLLFLFLLVIIWLRKQYG